jgi:hypothetical protein
MYIDDAADKESRVATMAVAAAGTTTWLLVDSDEKEVDAAAGVERDAELCVAVEVERVSCCTQPRNTRCPQAVAIEPEPPQTPPPSSQALAPL